MKSAGRLWVAVLLLVSSCGVVSANQAPGGPSTVRFEPEANELGEMGLSFDYAFAEYPQYSRLKYVNIGLDNYPDVTIWDFASILRGGLGWYQIGAHSSETAVEVEPYDLASSAAWTDAWNALKATYPSTQLLHYVHTDQNGTALYRVNGVTRTFLAEQFQSNQSVVHHNGCFGWGLRTGYVNALAYASWDDSLTNTVMRNTSVEFYKKLMNTFGHVDDRVFSTAASGLNSHFKILDAQHAVIAPVVANTSLGEGATISSPTTVTVNFDCSMNTAVPAANVVKGNGSIQVTNPQWTAGSTTQITCTVTGVHNGPGELYVDSYDPVHVGLTGAMSQPGHIGLDGNTDPWFGPNGKPPNGDDYVVHLTSAMGGDDPASHVSGFAAVRQGSGVRVQWSASLEAGAARYLVERAPDWLSAFVEVGSVAATGASSYAVDVAGPTTGIFRLREVEAAGGTLLHAWDEARDPFTIVPEPKLPDPDPGLMKQYLEQYPAAPKSVPENWNYLIFTPAAWQAQADLIANFWGAHGLNPIRITLESIGGASHIKEQIQLSRNYVKYVLLLGDSNDDADATGKTFWSNNALWAPWGAARPAWPAQTGLNFIPMSYYQPDPGTVTTGMAYFTPYTGSDWGYIDFDGDSLPDPGIAIGRAPVSSAAEALAFYQKTVNAYALSTSTTFMNHVGMWTLGRDVEGRSGALVEQLSHALAADLRPGLILDRIDDAPPANPMTQSNRNQAAKNALDQGRSLVIVMSTVGDTYHWGGFLDIPSGFNPASLLSNATRLPFLLGADCAIGDVDRTEDPTKGTPLLERFTNDPVRGPWGAFGPTRGSWVDGDYEVAHEFLTRVYTRGAASAGQAAALSVYNAARAHPEYKALARSHVFIGDPALKIPFMASPTDCNANGVADYLDIANGTSLDVNCDMIPDECQPGRVTLESAHVIGCPGGDADSIKITVDITGMCGVDAGSPSPPVMAIRRLPRDPSVRVWTSMRPTDPYGDTLRVISFNAATHVAVLTARALSGCGTLVYDVYAGGKLVKRGVSVDVRSMDFDTHAVGSIDKFDAALLGQSFGVGGAGCSDFDWSGVTDIADVSRLGWHMGHHVPRSLTAPNGGQSYAWGDPVAVSWVPGQGDSSTVTLYLQRDSQPGTRVAIVADVPDNGAQTWAAYPSDAPAGDYRVVVMHSAGGYEGTNAIGEDVADGTIAIDGPPGGGGGGGGCPFVDTRTAGGWRPENTILQRSTVGAFGTDVLHLQNEPEANDGRYRLRIRENEQEYTTLDHVALLAVDHPAEWEVFWEGTGPVLGKRVPAFRVTTRTGRDITSLVDGSGPETFEGQPGETLSVETRPAALAESPGGAGESGLVIIPREKDPGGLGKSSDAALLAATGIEIQVPDGRTGWRTLDRQYPREYFSPVAMGGLPEVARARLIFVGRHELRYIGWIQPAPIPAESRMLGLIGARHSGRGGVDGAVGQEGGATTLISPGDSVTMEFTAPAPVDGMVRDWLLVTRGVYTTIRPPEVADPSGVRPTRFGLAQSQPNPFANSITIHFDLPEPVLVKLEIFDLHGRRVRTLVDQPFPPGFHAAVWDHRDASGRPVQAGMYLYRLQAGSFHAVRKAVLLP